MAKKIKARAKIKNGLIEVKYKVVHPMETGRRKDKSGQLVAEDYINFIKISKNGKDMFTLVPNSTASKDPYFFFKLKGIKGDAITLSWISNTGEKNSSTTKVK
ncbi:MAG: thiosulfate oxidation carrier complex protein SoxZ [Candidatus Thioglobus sp.]|nr:thiosulfate oxidation carrier complex protein SoxZ [Candidatus Thioglobus pontius]MBL6984269.1 thiosulfate oxidation carrier complex protein SoxZ [Candidatus Thioglobus sp.]